MEVIVGIGFLLGMFALAAGMLFVRDRFFGPRRLSAVELEALQGEWDARLLAPDWPAVERQLGRRVPPVLRELYGNHALLQSAPFVVSGPAGNVDAEWEISSFHPADARGDHFEVPTGAFCFAATAFGDPYYVELGGGADDGPVWIRYHEGDDVERVADSLTQFLSWPRREA